MNDKEFNLLDEPWIRVIDNNCCIHEVSLMELFEKAHTYKDLCGELPTQDFAVLRLLLAVLHTVFSRYNVKGEEALLNDSDDALNRWKELWENKRFPIDVIINYLESQRENFYLFHPERPFYQCKHAIAGTEYSTSKLNGNLSESSNKLRLFTSISGEEKETMCFSEAVRWLIYVNAYDDTSAKSSSESKKRGQKLPSLEAGWLGKLGIVFCVGNNLFETLMLNMIMFNANKELFGKEHPIWECEKIPDEERNHLSKPPDNLSELYTLQSRRLYLKRNGQKITGYFLLGGDFFDKENAFIEPMTVWKNANSKKADIYIPNRHDFTKQFWREFPAVILDNEKIKPGIISWIKELDNEDKIENPYLNIRIVSIQYCSKGSSVTNVFSDSLQMHVSLISNMNIEWSQAVINSIIFCDIISQKVWTLAKEINLASGGSNSTKESKGTSVIFAESVKADFYNRIDNPFRRWLCELDPKKDDADEKEREWRQECVCIARKLGNEIIRQAGTASIFGRTHPSGSDDKNKNAAFSAASAMNKFIMGLKFKEES